MKEPEEIKFNLKTFLASDKFEKYGHLQPAVANSSEEDKDYISKEFDSCVNKLLQHLGTKNPTNKGLKTIVRNSLDRIENGNLDTEDREFCYELYYVIREILGIDIEDKSVSMEQKLLNDLMKIAKKAGLNLNDFLLPNSPIKLPDTNYNGEPTSNP
jgi:hypothetical protein